MRASLALACAALACAGAPPASHPASRRTHHDDVERPADPPPPSDARALGESATFADLVRAARTLDDRRDQESTSGCLLRAGWRLEADLAAAVRPLPAPPEDLGELDGDAAAINVLTRWGAYGNGDPERLTFAAITSTLPPRREPAIVWVVTSDGVFVRSSAAAASDRHPMEPSQAAARIDRNAGVILVSAEGGISLTRLASVLREIPDGLWGRVGLAVPLARGTRLPAPPAANESGDSASCPHGLPPLADDEDEGSLDPHAIVGALGPLREAAVACVGATQGAGAAGAHVRIAMRIASNGRVSRACATADDSGDAELERCLVQAAQSTAFPVPSPAGSVDVELPLALEPLASQRQRAICD